MPQFGSNVTLLEVEFNICVVDDGGALRCMGNNQEGLLGDGTTENSLTMPVEVFGFGTGAISMSMGTYHACGVKTEGGAFCWGYNYPGVLGNGGAIESASFFPVPVVGLGSGVSSISAGYDNSCALLASGGVRCWGQNLYGQLGTGESGAILLPTPVLIDEEIFRSGFD